MRRFLIKILYLLGMILFIAVIADSIITQGLQKSQDRKYIVWNDIYSHNINADVVALGSSRCWTTYNTYILDSLLQCNSYNLGMDGHRLTMQIARYHAYRRNNVAPKLLLLNVDFISTFHNNMVSGYEREQFFPYIKYDDNLYTEVCRLAHLTWADLYLPLYRYVGYREDIERGIVTYVKGSCENDYTLHKGFRSKRDDWSQGALALDTLFVINQEPIIERLLEQFIKEVQHDGTKVIMVKSPFYYPLRAKFLNIEYTDSVFQCIADRNNVPIIDFYDSPLCVDSTLFYNPSHMNTDGSNKFTTKLCEKIKK